MSLNQSLLYSCDQTRVQVHDTNTCRSPYPCAILPATARTLPGEACQIAIAESMLTAIATAKAMV